MNFSRALKGSLPGSAALAALLITSACAAPVPPLNSVAQVTTVPSSSLSISSSPTVVATPPPGSLDANLPAWATEGVALAAEQKANPPQGISNAEPFAYQSDAFDLTKDGNYDVVFHVPASFSLTPDGGQAIGLGFRMPDDRKCSFKPAGAAKLTATSTGYDLHFPFFASGVTFAYTGFSIWIY